MSLLRSLHFQIRHLILGLSTVCLTMLFSNSILLNFTIICMPGPCSRGNGTDVEQQQHFSPNQRSVLLSASAVGAILGGLPLNQLANRFSHRRTITGYGLLSGLATLATPLGFTLFGFPALLIGRILQGTSFPAQYVMNSVVSRIWAPVALTSTYLQLISSHFQLAPLYTMPLAGFFCESSSRPCKKPNFLYKMPGWGWPGIYYVQGVLTVACFLLFLAFFRDCPSEHPWCSDHELKLIQLGRPRETDNNREHAAIVPCGAIVRDWAVWLLMLGLFSDEIGYQLYTQLGPYYLNRVLGIGVAGTGFFCALPYMVSLASKLISGPLNDGLLASVMSEHARVKLFAAISQYGIAACLAILAFMPLLSHSLWLILPFYALMNMFTGLDFLGIIRCAQTMGGKHAELLMVWESIVSSCVAMALPTVVATVAPNDSLLQWMGVLSAIAVTVALCITAFTVFGKTRLRPWALDGEETGREERTEEIEKF